MGCSLVLLFLAFCLFFHNKSYHSLRMKFTHSLFFPTKLQLQTKQQQILNNPALQTLSAPNLVDGGSVCIGDDINQQFLDADPSSLVTGVFSGFSLCYGSGSDPPLAAPTVCGVEPDGLGLFTTDGCS